MSVHQRSEAPERRTAAQCALTDWNPRFLNLVFSYLGKREGAALKYVTRSTARIISDQVADDENAAVLFDEVARHHMSRWALKVRKTYVTGCSTKADHNNVTKHIVSKALRLLARLYARRDYRVASAVLDYVHCPTFGKAFLAGRAVALRKMSIVPKHTVEEAVFKYDHYFFRDLNDKCPRAVVPFKVFTESGKRMISHYYPDICSNMSPAALQDAKHLYAWLHDTSKAVEMLSRSRVAALAQCKNIPTRELKPAWNMSKTQFDRFAQVVNRCRQTEDVMCCAVILASMYGTHSEWHAVDEIDKKFKLGEGLMCAMNETEAAFCKQVCAKYAPQVDMLCARAHKLNSKRSVQFKDGGETAKRRRTRTAATS